MHALVAGALLHAATLFALLTALFMVVIRKVTQHELEKQLHLAVRSAVRVAAGDAGVRRSALALLARSGGAQRIVRELAPGSTAVRINNRWTTVAMLAATGVLALLAGVALLALPGATARSLLALNVVVFTGVAVVEGAFFALVALKYVPIAPSSLQTLFAREINAQLHPPPRPPAASAS